MRLTTMQMRTVRFVPLSEVLSRLPDEVDRNELLLCFSERTDFTWGTNSHSLVPWGVLVEDLTDCCIELGYAAPDTNKIFPPHIVVDGELNCTSHVFVDLES